MIGKTYGLSAQLRLILLAATAVLLAAAAATKSAYSRQNDNGRDAEVHVLPVRGNVYMLVGAGGNIAASVGRDGILLVDTGSAPMADKVLATVRQLVTTVSAAPVPMTPCVGLHCAGFYYPYGWSSPAVNAIISSPARPKPIHYIINTSIDPDHTGGNEKMASAGTTFPVTITGPEQRAAVIAHENVLVRMSASATSQRALTPAALPSETYHAASFKLSEFFNGEGVQIFHEPAAHTDGDSIVWFRFSDVISAGDIYSTTAYPVIDLEKGGSIQGIIAGLNHILDLAFPEARTQGGTMVIPGHGRLSDTGDVVIYRNMVVIIRDRIQDMIQNGMSLEQVKAARPTKDYDGRYGRTPGSTDKFVEAVYRGLTQKQ
jgi:glyoxylase-like metal-dependent hydrolase (beta-lactamase superfamily II)